MFGRRAQTLAVNRPPLMDASVRAADQKAIRSGHRKAASTSFKKAKQRTGT